MDKKIVVISGVNLIDAGPLAVFNDFLNTLVKQGYTEKYKVIALVGKKELFEQYKNKIDIVEFRNSKKNWINRLYLEFIKFKRISKKMSVEIWISMHDITPNVKAKHKYVYCHNPSPFNKMSLRESRFGLKYYLFSKFYKYLYKININKNDSVIVQQNWMRDEFIKMFNIKNVIVARPSLPNMNFIPNKSYNVKECIFICPSFPRYYKNFQIACEAACMLTENGFSNFKLFLTIAGDENKYSKYLLNKYVHCPNIIFGGLLERMELFKLYGQSDCLIFMSKLETWGMPITEYKITEKPMLVADLPYAHETVGTYNNVDFLPIDDSEALKNAMIKVIKKEKLISVQEKKVKESFAKSWDDLCRMIL